MRSREVLDMLEKLPAGATVHGSSAREIAQILRESIELREKLIAEQEAFPGQGGHERYSLPW